MDPKVKLRSLVWTDVPNPTERQLGEIAPALVWMGHGHGATSRKGGNLEKVFSFGHLLRWLVASGPEKNDETAGRPPRRGRKEECQRKSLLGAARINNKGWCFCVNPDVWTFA